MGSIDKLMLPGVKSGALTAFFWLFCLAPTYAVETVFQFDIPVTEAEKALDLLAEKTGHSLFYPADAIKSASTNALEGLYTLPEALDALLEGTCLNAVVTDRGVIVVSNTPETQQVQTVERVVKMKQHKLSLLSKITLILFGAVNAQGVSAQSPAPDQKAEVLEEVVVKGVRGSLARSLEQKRYSDGVVDGITSEDIGDFPDLNISESLQRITGVTINRVLGEGQQVSVRGLAPEFTRVTINGQTVTSGNSGREVDFDVFASELFSNVSLTKTPSAALTEGGLAATIDLRTARPFDFNEPVLAISGQGSINEMRDEFDPRVSAIASNTFMDGALGVLASLSYSESSLRQDNVEGLRFLLGNFDDGVNQHSNVEIPFIPRYLLEFLDRDRLGITGAIQFEPSDSVDLNFDVAYAEFDEVRTRYSIDGLLRTRYTPVEPIEVDSTGLVTRATFNGDMRDGEYTGVSSRSENIITPSDEDLLLINIDGGWRFADDWEIRGKFGYSDASSKSHEFRAVYQALNRFGYDLTDRIFLDLQPSIDFTDPSVFSHNQSRFINNFIKDEEYSFQSDLTRSFDDSFVDTLNIGVRYSKREASQNRFDGRITSPVGELPPTTAIATNLPVDDFFGQYGSPSIDRNWFVTDFDAVFADPTINGAKFTVPQRFIDSFAIEEETVSGYGQARYSGEILGFPVRGNIGVRIVNTDQTSRGFLADGSPLNLTQSYTEVLPSGNLAIELTDELLFRVAGSKSLTRPTLTKLSPGGTIAPTGLTASLGNPELNPFSATQFDLSLEWYFADEALASATFFYKDVESFIVNVTSESTIQAGTLINDAGVDVSNAVFTVTRPINGEGASVKGVELSLQTPFTFLPAPFDGFGMVLNYTYADSKSEIMFNNQTIKTLLPGQSESSYNLIGYYEKGKFGTRIAYSWRDEFLYEIRASNSQRSNFTASYGQLDLNAQYDITDNIVLTFDALNLLEEETQRFGESRDRNISFHETGRFFIVGARIKF